MRYTRNNQYETGQERHHVTIFSEEVIQQVRDATDLVALIGERVPVRQRGRDYWCCCPLHNEKTPSFKIDPSMQLWHCFGCGEGGDAFGFLMKTEDLAFPESVRKLAERAHIDLPESSGGSRISSSQKARLKEVCGATAEFYHTHLMRNPDSEASAARHYLGQRGLGGEVPKRWQLGFAPGQGILVRHLSSLGFKAEDMIVANVAMKSRDGQLRDRFFKRIVFPINDTQGDCIAFGGRVIDKSEPKYLNSQETPIFHKSQVLYGLDHAKATMASTGVAVVVEGYTDVIALHEAGIKNVVATLGTALTMRHIRLLSRHAQRKIVYLFDGDEAGQRAADRALGFIDESMTPEAGRSAVELAAVTLPQNLDPADFVEQRGVDALRELIDAAQPLLKYGIERRLATYDLSSAEGRSRALVNALAVLAPIKDSLLAKDYAVQIASRVRARETDVLEQLSHLKPPRRFDEDGADKASASRGNSTSGGNEEGSNASASSQAQQLSQTQLNRRRFEREFLSLVAQQPELALLHADALAQTQWHEPVHLSLAQSILLTLSDNPSAEGVHIITQAAHMIPEASGILTSGTMSQEAEPNALAQFLAEELSIGDAEDAVALMRAQLADPSSIPADEYEMLFQSVSAMQKGLTQRRLAHKPLMQ